MRLFLAENKMFKADKNIFYEQKKTSTGLAWFFKSSAVLFVTTKW